MPRPHRKQPPMPGSVADQTQSPEPKRLDDKHIPFAKWAQEQGVQINGVSAANLPGKGTGIVATKKLHVTEPGRPTSLLTKPSANLDFQIQKGDKLVYVPVSTLITLDSSFVTEQDLPTGCTVHGTIAAALARMSIEKGRWYSIWEGTWPSRNDFEESNPLCWSKDVQDSLPPTTKALRAHQSSKFEKDWRDLQDFLPGVAKEEYRYYWLVVNTRCFYWEYFKLAKEAKKKGKRLHGDDCVALCPFADYFNHEDQGCTFNYNASGCSIICDRTYDIGEEVVVSYGRHSNDYLLVDGDGFILNKNDHDSIKLDHLILPRLSQKQKKLLQENSYLNEYILDPHEICYRTHVALRSTITTPAKMQKFLLCEYDGSDEDSGVEGLIHDVLLEMKGEVDEMLEKLIGTVVREGDEKYVDVVRRRWLQMREMVERCKRGLEN